MDAYRELHEHESNPIKVGVDLTSVASAALAISDPEATRSSGGADKYEQQVAILPSFKVYWDDEDGEYKINDPKVVGPDGEIAVTAADKITAGTWYCKIYKDNGTWKAAIVDDNTDDENEPTYVPICTIVSSNDVVQHHIGTIVFRASGVTSLTGDGSLSQGQPSAKVDGDVEVTGKLDPTDDDTSCGIEFVTVPKREAQGGDPAIPARMIAMIKGRVADEEGWSAHTMTIEGEEGASDTEIHFLGSADCTIPRPSTPKIPDIEIDATAITSGKAVGGITVDTKNKHKIILTAIDVPDEQLQSDWEQTDTTAKDFIKNKPILAERNLTLNGQAASKKFYGTGDIALTITQKQLVAGDGIAITPSGNVLTISATGGGGSTTGFSGTRLVLADVDYDTNTNCLRKRFYTETWVNGVMKSSMLDEEWKAYHQAVPETF